LVTQGEMVKVVVGMSGGVDSSVAAALLKEDGYEVIGVTMQVWPPESRQFGGCCGITAIEDARKVARTLGIRHYVMNFREVFTEKVINHFIAEYRRGRTPNPCIRCNQYIKFGSLLEKAQGLGADFIATGHHARIEKLTCHSGGARLSNTSKGDEESQSGGCPGTTRYLLKKGLDVNKDQSYFLYALTQEQLSHSLMPIGNLTKEEVRKIARRMGLPVADKPQSQEICFIPDDDYGAFIKAHVPDAEKPGPVLDAKGNVIGRHRGIIFHTIGQRKGLGIAFAKPLYVIAIDAERNAIIVGTKEKTLGDELVASDLNWIAIDKPTYPLVTHARIRYRHPEAEAVVTPLDEARAEVKFTQPQPAITPGQAVVFYDEDTLIGGGTIEG